MIDLAWNLAREAHRGQKRKYTGDDYLCHPVRVASRVMMRPDAKGFMVAAALLHDVIEDCGLTEEDLRREFRGWRDGDLAVDVVVALTNPSKRHPGLKRAERKKMDREHLANQLWEVKVIKLLDRIDNVNEMDKAPDDFVRVYCEESMALADAIGGADEALRAELRGAVARLREGMPAPGEDSGHGQ